MSMSESFSMPLLALQRSACSGTWRRASRMTARRPCEGMTTTTSSAPWSASSRSWVARREAGSSALGR